MFSPCCGCNRTWGARGGRRQCGAWKMQTGSSLLGRLGLPQTVTSSDVITSPQPLLGSDLQGDTHTSPDSSHLRLREVPLTPVPCYRGQNLGSEELRNFSKATESVSSRVGPPPRLPGSRAHILYGTPGLPSQASLQRTT